MGAFSSKAFTSTDSLANDATFSPTNVQDGLGTFTGAVGTLNLAPMHRPVLTIKKTRAPQKGSPTKVEIRLQVPQRPDSPLYDVLKPVYVQYNVTVITPESAGSDTITNAKNYILSALADADLVSIYAGEENVY